MTSERPLDDALIIIGLFVGMTYHFRPVYGIGPVVGIGLFGGPGPVVSLTYGQRSDKRYLMAIKVKSVIFTQKERPTYCEQLLKI